MSNYRDVIIVGGGPAGLTAAIYTARANLKPMLVEGMEPGGQLTITTDVENFPGFPDGVMGPELIEKVHNQALRFGTEFLDGEVTDVDFSSRPFKLKIDDDPWEAGTVIISTGATAKWLGLESEKRLMGFGVSGCATCDGFFFTGKEVIVVGGGDTALEEATFLTRFASKVTVVHRRDQLRASKAMQKRAMENEKIEFKWNSTVEDVLGEAEPGKGVTGVILKNTQTGETEDFRCDGVFLGIGHAPNTKVFSRWVELDENGYIKRQDFTSRTNVPGVFFAGDVADTRYRQAITAAGMGCQAALDAEKFLEDQE